MSEHDRQGSEVQFYQNVGGRLPYHKDIRIQDEMFSLSSEVRGENWSIKLRLHLCIRSQAYIPNKRLHRLKSNQRRSHPEKNKRGPICKIRKWLQGQRSLWKIRGVYWKTRANAGTRPGRFLAEQNVEKAGEGNEVGGESLLQIKKWKEFIYSPIPWNCWGYVGGRWNRF